MNTLERLKDLEAKATPRPWTIAMLIGVPMQGNDMYLISEMRNALPKLLAMVQAGDKLATHVDGLLDLKAVSTPENTKHWLDEYRKARAKLEGK